VFQAVIRPEAIELMPLGVYVVDASGVIRQYNAHAAELWGRTPEAGAEARGWGGSDPWDARGEQPNPVAEVLADGQPRRAERVIVRPDGRRVHVSLSVGALRGAGGAVTGAVVCAQDVSRRTRTEQALTGQKRVLEMLATGRPLADVLGALAGTIEELVPGMRCAVLVVDPARAGRLVKGVAPSLPAGYWESFESLPVTDGCGSCGTAAATGRRCVVEDIAADPRWAGEPAAAALAHGLRACWSEPIVGPGGVVVGTFGCYFGEARGPRAEETAIVEEAAHLAGVALQHDRWRAELLAATAQAQAARAKAEAERVAAEAANRAKDQFLASLSHELRTPLSPVLLTASSLARDPGLPAHLRADMEMVQRSVELEARLIDDLLDHARIARGLLELHREEVDVHALLWRAAETSSAADSAPT